MIGRAARRSGQTRAWRDGGRVLIAQVELLDRAWSAVPFGNPLTGHSFGPDHARAAQRARRRDSPAPASALTSDRPFQPQHLEAGDDRRAAADRACFRFPRERRDRTSLALRAVCRVASRVKAALEIRSLQRVTAPGLDLRDCRGWWMQCSSSATLQRWRPLAWTPSLRGAGAAPVGAMVPATGRYAVQGVQVRAGLETGRAGPAPALWSRTAEPARAGRAAPRRAARARLPLRARAVRQRLGARGRHGQPGHRGLEPRRRRGRCPAPSWRRLAAVSGELLPGGSRPGGRCASARRRDRRRGRGRPLRAFCPRGARAPGSLARPPARGFLLARRARRDRRGPARRGPRPVGRTVGRWGTLPRPGRSPFGWPPRRGVARPGRLSGAARW